MAAIKDYGLYLDENRIKLDVKGSSWVCAFPEPNITVRIPDPDSSTAIDFGQLTEEEIESAADSRPSKFDFLGKHIDAGFRISRFAARDGFAVTIELAYLIGLCAKDDLNAFEFEFYGLVNLKGVVNNSPYPVFLLECERDSGRRLSRSLERDLSGKKLCKGHTVCYYLEAYFSQEKIELPVLRRNLNSPHEVPSTYQRYLKSWNDDDEARQKGLETEQKDRNAYGPEEISLITLETLTAEIERLVGAFRQSPAANTPSTPATPDAGAPPPSS